MGCDIHTYVECKDINGAWEDSNFYTRYIVSDTINTYEPIQVYRGRNYQLFSILANVRNYDDIDFISAPRGLPTDCCRAIKEAKEEWGEDAHSHSYFTLAELIQAKEDIPVIKYSGYMDKENAKLVDNGQHPQSWCKKSNIPLEYREWTRKNDLLDEIIESMIERAKAFYYAGKNYILENHYDDVRLVFWFDN